MHTEKTIGDKSLEAMIVALRDLPTRPDAEGHSAAEIAAACGVSVKRAHRGIGQNIASGKMRFAGMRRIVRIDGRPGITPVYALVKPTEKTR